MTYCETWARWETAAEQLREAKLVYKTKSGNPAVNPHIWILNALNKTLVKLASELGMSPIGRARMALEIQKADEDLEDYVERRLTRVK